MASPKLHAWRILQRTRALSVGEAEYYALVTGCGKRLGVQSLAKDMGYDMGVRVWTDSDAGRSMASRRALGKVRHMELRYLWVQEVAEEKRLEVRRVDGEQNIADHLTKGKHKEDMKVKIASAGGILILK